MTNKMVIFFEQVKVKTRATIHHQAQFIFLSYFVKIISSNKNLFFQLYFYFFFTTGHAGSQKIEKLLSHDKWKNQFSAAVSTWSRSFNYFVSKVEIFLRLNLFIFDYLSISAKITNLLVFWISLEINLREPTHYFNR